MRCSTVLKQKNPLPGSECHPSIDDGNVFAGSSEGHSQVAGAVIRTLESVEQFWIVLRNRSCYAFLFHRVQLRKLGPGFSFAKALLERTPELNLGLVVNAGDDTRIDEWLGKSKLYWGARGRTKAAIRSGDLKGVLWIPSRSDSGTADGYHRKMISLISQFRSDLSNSNLPFLLAGLPNADQLNRELIKVKKTIHAIDVIDTDDLSFNEASHYDATSQITLGKRFAEHMVSLRASLPPPPSPPTDLQLIDPHVHAMSVTPLGLRSVAKWMQERNVERCIVSPLNHKGSRPQTEEEYQTMLEMFRPYKGRIDRMCIIDAGEVETVDEALAILEKEIADGAIGFGEHYGRDLMFDDRKNLMLYEACDKVGLPVMFHIDQNKNMVTSGMPEVDRVLKAFPDCTLVAHAYWWRQFKNGTCDRQLEENPNLYADMSGKVVVEVLNRDRKYARDFLIRHQDRILWATDEGWWSFGNREKQMNQHYTILEELNLPDSVRHKIYRRNAIKVYGMSENEP